jgi:hypothetical protein
MYKVYDFRCPKGHVFEQFVRSGTEVIGTKMLSAPAFILDGHTGDFPGRHMRWVREHEKGGQKPWVREHEKAGQKPNLHND